MPGVNIELPCAAYTGNDSFAFISYAHLDAESVYPEIQRLNLMGYRIWYDEGIDPGNEWPEEVANALKKSTQFIVFVTQRAIESRNVRNEINYALKLNKPFLAIHLDRTELPPGMDLQMSSIQAILKWQTEEQTYIRSLERALPRTFGSPVDRNANWAAGTGVEIVELVARAIHSENPAYLAYNERRNWHQLNDESTQKIMKQSALILNMLHMAGINVISAKNNAKPLRLTKDLVNLLAWLEHDRWARERFETGWRYAEQKNIQRKFTPYLIPWSDIPEDVKAYDRYTVKQLPTLVLKAGYALESIYDSPDGRSLLQPRTSTAT